MAEEELARLRAEVHVLREEAKKGNIARRTADREAEFQRRLAEHWRLADASHAYCLGDQGKRDAQCRILSRGSQDCGLDRLGA